MIDWRVKGQPDDALPDYLKPVVSDEGFAKLCIYLEATRELGEMPRERDMRLVSAERKILHDVIGLPPDLARDFMMAKQQRVMLRDGHNNIQPSDQGGGINPWMWNDTLKKTAENTAAVGMHNVQRMHDMFGTTNFDRYSRPQFERMARFAGGDPNELEHFGNNDFSVMISDTFSDHNGSFANSVRTMDNQGNSLFFEARAPSDLYRPLIMLEHRYGISPSTFIINTHGTANVPGQTDGMHFGTRDPFVISADRPAAKAEDDQAARQRSPMPGLAPMEPKVYPITESSAGRFLGKYMQPSRQTGERIVILNSCLQAAEYESNNYRSTARSLSETTDPTDNVKVIAARESMSVQSTEAGIKFYHVREQPRPAVEFSNGNVAEAEVIRGVR